ncbi:dual oxidase 2 [Xenopus laevis]|uniref:NAD(P)H oxidase (H2O2-forming) n=2 Tax=Xenopus laevis TaxID=8355 RepID=A0A1L8H098_XENLA|nr:dual oxidase 2 [Xenopus laevis]OCT89499.1 hypothetical protein XELAEV_18018120mg [Xenopus laevis]
MIWKLSILLALGWIFVDANINWEVQRYDGWYNNLAHHSTGSPGSKLLRYIPAFYTDGVYQVPKEPEYPNPRSISNAVTKGKSALPSSRNLTVLAISFGYHMLSEVVFTGKPACPAEFINIQIPGGDEVFDGKNTSKVVIPFQRSKWYPDTGRSPNNPREHVNSVTAWIDGSAIYGSSHSWCDALRDFSGGKLASGPDAKFPRYAKSDLPMIKVPNPSTGETGNNGLYAFGNAMANESPFLQALGILWFRYHNYKAKEFAQKNTEWSDEVLFQHARKWVIAVYQNIVFYEWLPTFLSRNVTAYSGYQQHADPSISPVFMVLLSQIINTMMPSGFYMRNKDCVFQNVSGSNESVWPALRLCNNYWNRENPNLKNSSSIDELLMGMASQIAEKEDNVLANDLTDFYYGQIKYSRTDLFAASIQRARDLGLPSYNKICEYYQCPLLHDWENMKDKDLGKKLASLYGNNIGKLEFIPGLLSEMDENLSNFSSNIILEQFYRLRDGDRFWFENVKNDLFTEEDIKNIRNIKLQDVLLAVTNAGNSVQQNAFIWKEGDPCQQPNQLNSSVLELCVALTVTDYFEGCAAGFGISIAALCCLPLVSFLIAWLIARSQKRTFRAFQKKITNTNKKSMPGSEGFPASEWCGYKEPSQDVIVQLHPNQILKVLDYSKKKPKVVNLHKHPNVKVVLSNSDGNRTALIKIPKEYDLVLQFNNQRDRDVFIEELKASLAGSSISPTFSHMKEAALLKESFTKKQRQQMLETFIRYSLSHVIDINKEHAGTMQNQNFRDVLQCELSREEFADSLGLNPNAHFVESMFSMADKDQNGYLSFEEFCFILCSLIKGSAEDKLKFIFSMHDVNGNGILPKEEFSRMLRSFSNVSNFLSNEKMENVIQSMFNEAGIPNKQELAWEDFYGLFKDHKNILNQTKLYLDGVNKKPITNTVSINRNTNQNNYGNNIFTMGSVEQTLRKRTGKMNTSQTQQSNIYTVARRDKYETSKIRQKIQQYKRLVENYRRHIVCLVIFFGISAGLFVERAYYYGFASPASGIADSTYIGLIISRGSAASISFMFSYMLLTMCRNLITFLRETFLNRYIPFDAAVDFHRFIAVAALVLSILHTLGHLVNVYIFTVIPLSVLSCLFPTVFVDDGSDHPQKYYWWFFETVPGMTGVLLLAVMALMYVFSCCHFRRVSFRCFWITHHLYVVFYILTIIHGSFALIQTPRFHIFFIVPALIYSADKLISLSRKKIHIDVLDVERLPSDVIHLEFQRPNDFDYKSGQWVRIACLDLGTNEYHPFTLTSAPHEDTLSLHIRAVGPWTTKLRELYSSNKEENIPYPKLYLDGPFGEGHQEWNKFEVSVLVGGGIGVTPFASILKDLVFKASVNSRIHCKKVYFIWVTRTQHQFEWLTDIIREVEKNDQQDLLSVHIYITQLPEKFDFRTTMLYICEQHFQKVKNHSLMTGLRSVTHFGRPPFAGFLSSLQDAHPKVKKIGVFSCGPPGMTKNVENACRKLNKRDESYFIHHYENF